MTIKETAPAEPKVTVLPYMGEPKPGDKRYIPPHITIPLTHAQLKDLKDGK
jgi:hypothetical protein